MFFVALFMREAFRVRTSSWLCFCFGFLFGRGFDDFEFSPENGVEFCLQIGGILGEVIEQCDLGDDVAGFWDRVKIFGFLAL